MKRKIISFLALIALLFSLNTEVFAAAHGDAKFVLYDVTANTTVCTAVYNGATCTNAQLVNGHFYTLTGLDATGLDDNYVSVIGAHNNALWAGRGAYVNYHGATAPTCTYTDTSTRWQYSCTAPTATIISVVMYGYASSITDSNGKVNVQYSPNLVTGVVFNYSTP